MRAWHLFVAPLVAASPLWGDVANHISGKRQLGSLPSYALDYAPLVYLHSTETYFPSDIGAQLTNTRPEINFAPITPATTPLTLDNLNTSLSAYPGAQIYLTSLSNPATRPDPAWLHGVRPDASGSTGAAVSCAIITSDHGGGLVDVYYMYFYAFNYGTFLTDLSFIDDYPIGDHVGDWEHTMIRFQDGAPQAMWFSQHDNGEAFTYDCLEKQGMRPVVYSANGSHANYAISGTHSHGIPNLNLPWGPVNDYTNKGPLWDPAASAYAYSYDHGSGSFAAWDGTAPTDWLSFTGQWGDQGYPKSDARQKEIFGIAETAKWVGGPTGPEDKQLYRSNVCPDNGDLCIVRPALAI